MTNTVLVTGANGFLGNAVAKAFALAGWKTYGLTRRETAANDLWTHEVIPVIGSSADPSFVDTLPPIDVIAATTEDPKNYKAHFNDNVNLFKLISQKNRKSAHSVKPLVIFTSGCKDYGMTVRHGDPNLQPHTERSPLQPFPAVKVRCEMSPKIFEHGHDFDAVVTRATTFYGSSGTFYAVLFDKAGQAANAGQTLTIDADPNSIVHGTHIFDVASAYVAIATAPREEVVGEAFNISCHRYETAGEVAQAVEKSYGIKTEFIGPKPWGENSLDYMKFLMDFPQWVDSSKLRAATGWRDKMPLFTDDLDRYRRVYEAFAQSGHERVGKMAQRAAGSKGIE